MTERAAEQLNPALAPSEIARQIEELARQLRQLTQEGRIDPRRLADISQRLEHLSRVLSLSSPHTAEGGAGAAGEETGEADTLNAALEGLRRALRDAQTQQTVATQATLHQTLREDILRALARRGSLLPIELAAATLSLPEEIQPVLEELVHEGLVEIHEGKQGRWVTLTPRGRSLTKQIVRGW